MTYLFPKETFFMFSKEDIEQQIFEFERIKLAIRNVAVETNQQKTPFSSINR